MSDLELLRQRWQETGSQADYESYLSAKVRAGRATYVFLDPDGSIQWPMMTVIVLGDTNVVYGSQCRAVACTERWAEGYLVPVGGVRFDNETEMSLWNDTEEFSQVFHSPSGGCLHEASGHELAPERLGKLESLVADIAFWTTPAPGSVSGKRLKLSVDHTRLDDLVEAWVPVTTPNGPGVLVWHNCD